MLTYGDIITRQRNLLSGEPKCNINVNQVYESLKENYSYQKAKLVLENWTGFKNEDIAIDKVLEVFTIIADNDYALSDYDVNIYHHSGDLTPIYRKYMLEKFGTDYAVDYLINY